MTDAIDRAARAQSLLDDDLLKEAFDSFDAGCIQLWRDTDPDDIEGRERLWRTARVAKAIRDNLQAIVDDGTAAAAKIAEIQQRRPSETMDTVMARAFATQTARI